MVVQFESGRRALIEIIRQVPEPDSDLIRVTLPEASQRNHKSFPTGLVRPDEELFSSGVPGLKDRERRPTTDEEHTSITARPTEDGG